MNNNTSQSFLSRLYGGEFKFSKVFWFGLLLSAGVNLIIILMLDSFFGIGLNYLLSLAYIIALYQSRNNIKRKWIATATLVVWVISWFYGIISMILMQANLY